MDENRHKRADRIKSATKQILSEAYEDQMREVLKTEPDIDAVWNKIGSIIDEYDSVCDKIEEYWLKELAIEGED